MKRLRLSALIFLAMLLAIFFHNVYVLSVRNETLAQISLLAESPEAFASPDTVIQTWKNRKGLLTLSTPLTVLDQIDLQFAEMQASIQTEDAHGYASACRHLQKLLSTLGR